MRFADLTKGATMNLGDLIGGGAIAEAGKAIEKLLKLLNVLCAEQKKQTALLERIERKLHASDS